MFVMKFIVHLLNSGGNYVCPTIFAGVLNLVVCHPERFCGEFSALQRCTGIFLNSFSYFFHSRRNFQYFYEGTCSPNQLIHCTILAASIKLHFILLYNFKGILVRFWPSNETDVFLYTPFQEQLSCRFSTR